MHLAVTVLYSITSWIKMSSGCHIFVKQGIIKARIGHIMQHYSHSNHNKQCWTPLCKIFLEVKLLLHEIKLNYCFNMFWTPFEHTRSKQFSCLRHNSYLKANVRISCWRTVKQTNKYLQLTNADKLKIMVNTIKLLNECYVIKSFFVVWCNLVNDELL